MSKEEIALELTKLSFDRAIKNEEKSGKIPNAEKVVTDLYNYIFSNISNSEQGK